MPNWIKNRIITGSRDLTDKLIKKYGTFEASGETESVQFDFNKVIPMPKDLQIEFSSRSDNALILYLTKVSPYVDYYGNDKDKFSFDEFNDIKNNISKHMMFSHNLTFSEDALPQMLDKYNNEEKCMLELGKTQVNNIIKYNALNWYEWSINNWGTKWNSDSLEVDENKQSLTFETAWDPAIPVFLEITKQNPTKRFAFLYADEAIGSHVGYVLASNGKIDYKGTFEDYSVDAYKLSFDLWDCADEYKYDSNMNTYVYKDELVESLS